MKLADTLRKVDPDTPVVDKHVLHLEVSTFRVFLLIELDECILKRVARLLVSDHLAAQDLAKAREDELQVFASRDWIELADKENVFWRSDFCKR